MIFVDIIKLIVSESGKQFGVTYNQIFSNNRYPEVCKARYVAMSVCFDELKLSLTTIGRLFMRDHTTVIYGLNQVSEHEELFQATEKVKHVYKLLKD